MTNGISLRYFLPRTVITVRARIRYVVSYDEFGGHLEPRSDVRWDVGTVADRHFRCTTTFASGPGASPGCGVDLSAEGLIREIGASAPRTRTADTGPVPEPRQSSWSPERPEAHRDLEARSTWTGPGDLRRAFSRANPRTAALIEDLSSRAEQFLAGMRMSDGPAEVEQFGQALTTVERELAAADRVRREWIAGQGFTSRDGGWQGGVDRMVHRTEDSPLASLPADLMPADEQLRDLADRFGVLPVAYDPERPVLGAPSEPSSGILDRVDDIVLRRPRPVTVAIYRRVPESLRAPGDPEPDWDLDPVLGEELDVLDMFSELEVITPGGSGIGADGTWAVLHPRGTVSAVGTGPRIGAPGGIPEQPTSGDTADRWPDRTAVASAAMEAAGLQLALLRASNELTRLAATHAHAGELSALERDTWFASR